MGDVLGKDLVMHRFLSGGIGAVSCIVMTGAFSAAAQVARPQSPITIGDSIDLLSFVRGGGGGGRGGGSDRGGGGNDRGSERGDRGGSINIPGRSGAGADRSRSDAGHSASHAGDRDTKRAAGDYRDPKKHRKHRRDHDSGGFDDSDRVGDAWAYCVKRDRSGQVVAGTYVSPDGILRFCR